ncbi:MAG: hypothetical protein HZA35_03410 [Parcubacteria group bacterium]|nr:hypothetical protein [Parcubacteria group bacterium]
MFIQIGSYVWTQHVKHKMQFYQLSEARVKRVIRFPERIEEGIAPDTVACMQKAGSTKKPHEIWAMYQMQNKKLKTKNKKNENVSIYTNPVSLKIISAWKYPGISPKNNPIPQDILDELRSMLD